MSNNYSLNIDQIKKFIPHKYPFILIDRILSIKPLGDITNIYNSKDKIGSQIEGIKGVTYNEPFFQGHFPNRAIMPGVLLLEVMAQASLFLCYPYINQYKDKDRIKLEVMLAGVKDLKFRKPVTPGDTIHVFSSIENVRSKIMITSSRIEVNKEVVTKGVLTSFFDIKKL